MNRTQSANRKLRHDLASNAASFAVVGVSGVLLNVIIGRFYGAAALGVFNQLFALYIFGSQIAVLGVHFSTLKYISEHREDPESVPRILTSAILAAVMTSTLFCILAWFCGDFVGALFASEAVRAGYGWMIAALWFFSLNKVLIAVLNGMRYMHLFAVAQASRVLLMLVALVVFLIGSFNTPHIAVVLVAEIALFIWLCTLLLSRGYLSFKVASVKWIKLHLLFGSKSFLSGSMSELNSRVDVLILGAFVSDSSVGVYSMAAMIVEGIAQLPIVIRNNLNPILTALYFGGMRDELARLCKTTVRRSYFALGVICAVAIILYPFFSECILANAAFADSWIVFTILVCGLTLSIGFIPLDMLLVQCGQPAIQTAVKGAVLLSNTLLNLLLVPFFGIVGAAIGTGLTYVLSVIFLRLAARRCLGLRL